MAKHKETDEQIIEAAEKLVDDFEKLSEKISKHINKKISKLRDDVRKQKDAIEATRRIHRLAIAMSRLVDVTNQEDSWSRGLLSREQYDALMWEFHHIYNLTFYDHPKWHSKDQHKEAIDEIVNDYREMTGSRRKKG